MENYTRARVSKEAQRSNILGCSIRIEFFSFIKKNVYRIKQKKTRKAGLENYFCLNDNSCALRPCLN